MSRRKLVFWALVGALLGAGTSTAGLVAASGNRELPPAKQQVLDQQAAARAHARVVAHPNVSAPPPSTLPPRVPGIVSTGVNEGPFSASEFTVSNVWNGPVVGSWYLVYAGEALDPGSGTDVGGAVRIYSLPIDPNAEDQIPTFVGAFRAPGASGKLTVTSVQGHTLKLTADPGVALSFDLVTHTFG